MPGWKSRLKQSATEFLKLPPDALLEVSRVTCVDGKNVVVENARRLLKVENTKVTLDLGEQILTIHGQDFEIILVTDKEVHVTGQVASLEYTAHGRGAL
ncbi:YabP/YqfC family sporulation protein [Alicyclobacillus suci]|uniref:YabP/YqfC family sporulation protein n=1 Tax=Alicyclobacillus suci TaxID=2816080 RepID=UPI001A8D685D|nr:YabP/YqfC family sporulation protein [Alicyclobacillus suci]